ncbi:UPF0481 protein At3g47200-like [Pyrus x bretschneideri]|uniref:UPF0481 protein At3g47200-like n=1 Tax=Pyrus x bretschneideri TaxID=225117 RepID=UPI00202E19F2|nr:UPF0481 protein At3g47200-like [Pyrus x bretschneideri]
MPGNKVEDSSNQAPEDIESANEVASKKGKDSNNQAPDDKKSDDIVTLMRKKLDGLSPLSPHCCIYRVPERLRWVKRPLYTPHVVSIGPLHHYRDKIDNKDRKVLLYMEEHKQRYLQHFLRRTGVDLEVYVKKIMAQEERLRGSYEGRATEFEDDKFVSIILVDAAFIIELLLRNFKRLEDDNDWIFKKPWMLQNIAPDMILLENQLPFFILEVLFAFVPPQDLVANDGRPRSIIELSCEFFQKTVVRLKENEDTLANKISSSSEVKHFVDLIRTLHLPPLESSKTGGPTSCCSPKVKHLCDRIRRFLPTKKSRTERPLNTPCAKKPHQAGVKFQVSESSQTGGPTSCCSPKVKHLCDRIRRFLPTKKSRTERPLNTPCAKKLHQAGVKFQVSESKNLFDISFNINKGILEIPQLEIHDYTELTLRNLLAFEQCHCMENHISDYLRIMDGFVNTPMDVHLLVESGIFVNTLGDNNKVSDLINKLCTGVSWNNESYYFAARSEDLNNYCRQVWNQSKASLKRKYFNTPLAVISVIAAGFLILFTIIQTVCSLISVIN